MRSMTEILQDLEICTMNITSLDLSQTSSLLSGTLPAKLSTFINLEELDLHGTRVNGPIAKELSALKSLNRLCALMSQCMWR